MSNHLLFFLLFINTLLSFIISLSDRKRPASSWAWLLILLCMPYLGMILYFIFGRRGIHHASFLKKHNNDSLLIEATQALIPPCLKDEVSADNELVSLNVFMAGSDLSSNNTVQIYHEGQPKFLDLINDIQSATSSIHILYYIIRNDTLGNQILTLLSQKAKVGVEVRLVVDKLGGRFLTPKVLSPLIAAGGQLAFFAAPPFVRLNFRNHRKICIIDGQIGYIGGFNIGNEYLGQNHSTGYWRDCHVRLTGSAVRCLQTQFIMDFNYSHKEKIQVSTRYFPPLLPDLIGTKKVQIVSSGPDTKYNNILYAYLKLITSAKKSVYVQTPYFIPDESLLDALITACYSGLDVRVIIPFYPNQPFVYAAATNYLGELIRAGAKCYAYQKGFVHAKLIIVDGEIASIGTANMDIRSLRLNFEINAFIYDEAISKKLEHEFLIDVENSLLLDYNWYINRPLVDKVKAALCSLISPLL